MDENSRYDVLIIGGGPAGLSSAIYASRYMLKVLVLTEIIGGAITRSLDIENYPGTVSATGAEMMNSWKAHAEKFGAMVVPCTVKRISKGDCEFTVETSKGTYKAHSILFATGTKDRHLSIPGETRYIGKGVSYCPTCDGMFFKGKSIAVIGGGDAALRGAQVMLQYASKVYLIHRRGEFRAEPILVETVRNNAKTEFVLGRTVIEIFGDKTVKGIRLDDGRALEVQGVFVEIGAEPNSHLASSLGVELIDGFVKVGKDMSTNVPGVYAAGDITNASNMFRQVITAAAEGAVAAESIFQYVSKKKCENAKKESKENE